MDVFKEVPDSVVDIVQKMLDNASFDIKSQDSVAMTTKPSDGEKIVLNIWDFAGKEVYYTTHQVFLTSRALYVIVFNLTDDLEEVIMDSQVDQGQRSLTELMMQFFLSSTLRLSFDTYLIKLHNNI